MFIVNTVVALFLLTFSIVWIPLTYVAQFLHWVVYKLLGGKN
jgi:hypothetical protein